MTARISVFLNGKSARRHLTVESCDVVSGFTAQAAMESLFIADGGVSVLGVLGLSPSQLIGKKVYWTGDGDSLSNRGRALLHGLRHSLGPDLELRHKAHQDSSDLAVALDLMSKRIKREKLFIEVFGALGGRFDHALINILELRQWLKKNTQNQPQRRICVVCHPLLVMTNAPAVIKMKPGRAFSMVTERARTSIEIGGAAFGGIQRFCRPSSGLSNIATQSLVHFTPRTTTRERLSSPPIYFVLMS